MRSRQNRSPKTRKPADSKGAGYCGGYRDGAAVACNGVANGPRHVCGDDIGQS